MSFNSSTTAKSTSKPMTNIRLKTAGLQFKCCAPGCDVSKATNISLHPFPNAANESDRHQIWKRLLLMDHTVKPSDVVCARHFPKESFKQNADGSKSIFLRSDAYPYATSKLKLRIDRRRAEKASKQAHSSSKARPNQDASCDESSSNNHSEIDLSQHVDFEVEIIEEAL